MTMKIKMTTCVLLCALVFMCSIFGTYVLVKPHERYHVFTGDWSGETIYLQDRPLEGLDVLQYAQIVRFLNEGNIEAAHSRAELYLVDRIVSADERLTYATEADPDNALKIEKLLRFTKENAPITEGQGQKTNVAELYNLAARILERY